ncbi:MAG: hypothetical protein GVY36_11985 [Verrucomicrobia bacterium]|jgi:hypothetical protein|nr:hypothetical protein [Verrucomicrobiota bacterium]
MTQFLIVGILYQDWSEGSMVVHPFRLGVSAIRRAQQRVHFKILKGKHLLETALDWQAKRALNPHIQTAQVAQEVGVSTGRVRQIMRFAGLHPEIQQAILKMQPKKAKERFPERLLRGWITLDENEQLSQFRAYIE